MNCCTGTLKQDYILACFEKGSINYRSDALSTKLKSITVKHVYNKVPEMGDFTLLYT